MKNTEKTSITVKTKPPEEYKRHIIPDFPAFNLKFNTLDIYQNGYIILSNKDGGFPKLRISVFEAESIRSLNHSHNVLVQTDPDLLRSMSFVLV